jgi:hypothetical protein
MDHGGKKSGSGRGKRVNKAPARKGARKAAAARKRSTARKRTTARKTSRKTSRARTSKKR